MPPALEPVTPELMLDTLDSDKLRLNKVHFRAIALLLEQAGKADKSNNIAECRRCCTAILKFDIKYPPKHAFWPQSASEPADAEAPEGEAVLSAAVPSPAAPALAEIAKAPATTSPSLREGAGGRVSALAESPKACVTSVPITISTQPTPSSDPSVLS
ncbi:MAG: hypothetical protein ACREJO_10730, partial [Phycisphaerales bacterium]